MKLYADGEARRARQVAGDVLVVLWVLVWVRLAVAVHGATLALAVPGERMRDAGSGLAGRLRDAGSAVGSLPVVGDQVASPFDGAGRAADRIADAGAAQVQAVHELAWWLGLVVGAAPVLLLLAVYVPLRWRFVREATAGQRYVESAAAASAGPGRELDLFALRALARQPLHRLARVSPDPARAWRDGDPDVVRALAELELRDSGLSARAVAGPAAARE
jgi:hypothetical protein